MPWSWQCKSKFIRQNPTKSTMRRYFTCVNYGPSPASYEAPAIIGGKGYSKITRAPEFTFGRLIPLNLNKPVLAKSAPLLDVSKLGRKGKYKIKHGIMSERIEKPQEKSESPGPASYAPQTDVHHKRSPAYSLRPVPRPHHQSKSEWTPPPNMYLVDRPTKAAPAYSFGRGTKETKIQNIPQNGDYSPKFNLTMKRAPGFTFGTPSKALKPPEVPAPNAYCDKKFMYSKPSTPVPSFGIRHSRYLGKENEFLKPSDLSVNICGE